MHYPIKSSGPWGFIQRYNVLSTLFLATITGLTFLPFYFLVITSFKTTSQMQHHFMSPTLPLHWENYVVAFNQLGKYFWNTVLVTASRCRACCWSPPCPLSSPVIPSGRTVLFYTVIAFGPLHPDAGAESVWIKQLGLLNTGR